MESYPVYKMQVMRDWRLEDCTEAAVKMARERNCGVEFDYDRKRYAVMPGCDFVQEIGVLYDDNRELIDSLRMCCERLEWFSGDARVVAEYAASGKLKWILVTGPNSSWLESLRRQVIYELVGPDTSADFFKVTTRRTVELKKGTTVRFEVLARDTTYRFAGMKFDVAFVEESMGGNYNEFPWRSTTREAEKWRERQERRLIQDQQRMADYQNILALREAELKLKAQEERAAMEPAPPMILKARSLGASVTAVEQMKQQAQAMVNLRKELEMTKYQPIQFTPSDDWGTTYPSYGGIRRKPATAEGKLEVVRSVLLGHLRKQLAVAPSMGAVYADGITAGDIQRVVDALEESPSASAQPFWLFPDGTIRPLEATAEDGSKIVLSGEKTFQTGVIFDPTNRPIRKFRLKEESAA